MKTKLMMAVTAGALMMAGSAMADVTLKCNKPPAAPSIPDAKTASSAALREAAKEIETKVPQANAYMDCLLAEMNRVKNSYDVSVSKYKKAVEAYNARTGR